MIQHKNYWHDRLRVVGGVFAGVAMLLLGGCGTVETKDMTVQEWSISIPKSYTPAQTQDVSTLSAFSIDAVFRKDSNANKNTNHNVFDDHILIAHRVATGDRGPETLLQHLSSTDTLIAGYTLLGIGTGYITCDTTQYPYADHTFARIVDSTSKNRTYYYAQRLLYKDGIEYLLSSIATSKSEFDILKKTIENTTCSS